MKIDTRTLRQPLSPLRWALLLLLPALLPGCEQQAGNSVRLSSTTYSEPRIWYWETRVTAPVIGSQLCEPMEGDTGEKAFTCRVPVLQGSDENPVILAVSEGGAFEVKRWNFPNEWDPPGWPFQLEHPGNTVGEIHLSRTVDMHQQAVPLNKILWRLFWDAEYPPPLAAWVVFRVATSAGGDPLEVAMYYDGNLEQPWQEAGAEGESTSRCAGQRSGGGTTEVPCYLPAPPPGEAYQVEVWLRGADRAVETILLSRTELVDDDSETRLGCPGMTEGPYTLYYPDRNGNGDGDPEGEPVAACGDVAGYVPNAEDCEGEVCETSTPMPEKDLDQDGFSQSQGDCNDDDPLVHPGAVDPEADGVDQDCGGLDGPQPHVGLNERSAASLQGALDSAPNDPAVTVWVGPGTYYEYEVTFRGKALRLKSTHGQEKTSIDAQQQGTVMLFDSGEAGDTVVEGFTITGGKAGGSGGGMKLWFSSPTLTNLILTKNLSTYHGGGIFLESSKSTLTGITVSDNVAVLSGGGMYMSSSSPTLTKVTLSGNSAATGDGGGISIRECDPGPTLIQMTILSNSSLFDGGGIYVYFSSATLTQVTLADNSTRQNGGGMCLLSSNVTLTQVDFLGNSAQFFGGGVRIVSANATLTQVNVTGNEATGEYGSGGGMALSSSSPTLTQVTLTGNSADVNAGGMYLNSSSPVLLNSILAYNNSTAGGNLFRDIDEGTASTVSIVYSNVFNPPSFATDNITPTGTYLTMEPAFLAYSDSTSGTPCTPGSSITCLPSDLHLALDSPLINAGDSSLFDPDGSRSDIGSYGGPGGDAWDLDGDGLPNYFWPGTWNDAPEGFESTDYDCDDLDPTVGGCP